MSETVNDIIGKGFGYEERVEVTTLVDRITGTKVAFVGGANWGPINTPTQIIKNFKSYFGSEVNRDVEAKDYSGITAAAVLDVVPSCFFTRITDGSDTAASKLLAKAAVAAKFTGAEAISGRSLKVNDQDNIFTVALNGGSDTVVTLSKSARCSAITSESLSATNFASGDYIELFVDGVAYQYIISSSTDILCKLTGVGALTDENYGGVTGAAVMTYIDKLVYALKKQVIGTVTGFTGYDPKNIIRKSGSAITINSNEYGASSSIRITSFPVVFPSVTATNPSTSTSANTSAEAIVTAINAAITADAAAFLETSGKFAIQTNDQGASYSIELKDEPTQNLLTDGMETALNLLGTDNGGDFAAGSPSYTTLSNDLKVSLDFYSGQTVTYTAGTDSCTIVFSGTGIVAADICPLPAGTYTFHLATTTVVGDSDVSFTLAAGEVYTWTQVLALMQTAVRAADADWTTAAATVTIDGSGDILITVTGAAATTPSAAAAPVTGVSAALGTANLIITTTSAAIATSGAGVHFTAPAYTYMELYFTLTTAPAAITNIKVDIYKANELIATHAVVEASASTIRVGFYSKAAGEYSLIFRAGTVAAATSMTIDNLFVGVYRYAQNGNLLDFLAVKDNDDAFDYTDIVYTGEAASLNMGTLTAKYTGTDGNNIYMVKGTSSGIPYMEFWNDTSLIARITNYSSTVAADTFFGTLINNDTRLQNYVTYTLPSPAPVTIDPIPNGTYQLNGGTSGISNSITDAQYSAALNEYKNMDIFDIDILCVTGNSTAIVIAKIQEVCEYRKDCFGVVDPPETVAGKLLGSIDQMIYWHNGDLPSILNMQLDSKYLVTYFPWVLVDTASAVTSEQWMPPSRVAVPAIVAVDREFNQYTPAAGKFAPLADVNDIAIYLTEEDKGRAYDDNIGNNINPIVYTNKQGFFIDGQKTTQRTLNAYNRIGVMRVSLFMKRMLMNIVPDFFYLPITKDTRDEFEAVIKKDIITPLINAQAIKPEEGVDKDWAVITDPAMIDADPAIIEASNGMISMIIWTPIKKIEKIKVISVMRDTQVIVQF